jgi:hypothetical protein
MTDIDKIIDGTKKELIPFESWGKLPGESSMAYAAFTVYRDYGAERNIHRAVEAAETDKTKREKRYRMWRNWATQFKWRERAADYDRYLEKLKQTELRKTIEARGEAHRKVTDKMLQVVSKKLDLMEPGELTQGAVVEWVEAAINTERAILGVAVPADGGKKQNANNNGQLEIQFTQEFEGL